MFSARSRQGWRITPTMGEKVTVSPYCDDAGDDDGPFQHRMD
jgi:hypothetical protein